MEDILPDKTALWQHIEGCLADIGGRYGFREIRMPLVEQTELFARSIGEVTDIVEKEMYTFLDRNNLSLSLRPEGTAGCVRAAEEHGLLYNQIQKLWYTGPMFRYEKPQKGRQRQFHQFGFEMFGLADADADAELIILLARAFRELGVIDGLQLQINSIGSLASRQHFKQDLIAYLERFKSELDEDSQRRLTTNPLRILDSKVASTQVLLEGAPSLIDYLDDQAQAHFAQLRQFLDAAKVQYVINPRLVRGLDYYNHTVFEWVTNQLGAQGTLCAGGRYDRLVEHLGGKPTPAVGCGIGLERMVLLLETRLEANTLIPPDADVYLVAVGQVQTQALLLAEQLRDQLPHVRVLLHLGGGSFKSQMKRADKSGAQIALIIGEDEASTGLVGFKTLRLDQAQRQLSHDQLAAEIYACLT